MSVYNPNQVSDARLSNISERDKYNNQIVLSGAAESFLLDDGVFFLEYIQVQSGQTVVLKDGKGNEVTTIVGTANPIAQDHSPIRFNYGIQYTGTAETVKGFYVKGVLPQ